MRSLREETKFHQMWRGPSMAAPPTTTKWASRHRLHGDAVAGLEHQKLFRPVAVAADLDLAGDDIDGALLVLGDRAAGSVPALRCASANTVSHDVVTGERRPCIVPATTRSVRPLSRNSGISADGGMGEGRRRLFVLDRQRDP